jgi:pimeloyl-ACP methyl ester carboxylesterase
MDAAGFGQAVVFGLNEGGPQAIVFAATRPERTRALILSGTGSFNDTGWDDIDRDPADLRARYLPEFGEKYSPSTEQFTRMQEFGRAVLSGWGSGAALSIALPSVRSMRHLAMFERMSASPGMRRAMLEAGPGSMSGRSCRRSPRPPWSSMPAATSFRSSSAGTSPTTSPARGTSRSTA